MSGRVIGINTAIASDTGANSGVGFTIPIDMARTVMDQLIENGRVIRGWLGISFYSLRPEVGDRLGYDGSGIFVSAVLPTGPADKAGLLAGDLIIELDGVAITDGMRFRKQISDLPPGTEVQLTILRPPTDKDGEIKPDRKPKKRKVTLRVAERPGNLEG